MTSPCEQVTIRCPECDKVYETWYRASINLDLDPGLGDPAYLEEVSTGTCLQCGHKVDLGGLVVRSEPDGTERWEAGDPDFREPSSEKGDR